MDVDIKPLLYTFRHAVEDRTRAKYSFINFPEIEAQFCSVYHDHYIQQVEAAIVSVFNEITGKS